MSKNQNLSLTDYQKLISKFVVERGFDKETVNEVFTLLIEEIGELAKAIRKHGGVKIDKKSKQHSLEEETADVFWLLIDLCNRLDIDLEEAFYYKELKNKNRKWENI